MKKMVSVFTLMLFAVSSVSAALPTVFTQASQELAEFKNIKRATASPDAYSPELAVFASVTIDKISATIPAADARREDFEPIYQNALAEISNQKITLNRLNYVVFQMAIAMNPHISSHYKDVFEGVDLLIEYNVWRLPYDQAYQTALVFGEQAVVAGHFTAEDKNEFDNFVLTTFRPCDRGLWVFPFVNDNPIYGIKTYLDAFVDGITMTGLPLVGTNCKVHEGLIKADDYAYFLFHDLAHLQSMADGLNVEANKEHVASMMRVTRKLMAANAANPDENQQQQGYGILFWLTHELLNYIELKNVGGPFKLSQSDAAIFKGMIDHAQAYLEYTIPKWLSNKDDYYFYKFGGTDAEYDAIVGKNLFSLYNEDGALDSFVTPWGTAQDCKDKVFCVSNQADENNSWQMHSEGLFYSYSVRRAFAYSQVELMKIMGNLDDGVGTYGATLATFDPEKANVIMHGTLFEFAEICKPLLN